MKKLMLIMVVLLFVVSGASASVDRIHYAGGWQDELGIASETYTALAADGVHANTFYGAKSGGGVDKIYHNGSAWVTETDIVSGTYTALAADGVDDY